MEKYWFLNYSDYDKHYFDLLYDKARQGGNVEGMKAVEFFKLANVSQVRIWKIKFIFFVHSDLYLYLLADFERDMEPFKHSQNASFGQR